MNDIKCTHNGVYWAPLTKEWYFITKETECFNPDCTVFGIKYCPWCGRPLPSDGKIKGKD